MYAPIYFPPVAPPSAAVLAAERAILDTEGPSHVAGRYIRDAALCDRERRLEAERRVALQERQARWLATRTCAWCGRAFVPGAAYEILGGEPVHAQPCRLEFDDARPRVRAA